MTEYTCNTLDMVTSITYNSGKEVQYQYNAAGELVRMEDWTESNAFEAELLHRITAITNGRGLKITCVCGETGNQDTVYIYGGRVNLIEEEYGKNKKLATIVACIFDKANWIVLEHNENGECQGLPVQRVERFILCLLRP